jgi:hypothetical protein
MSSRSWVSENPENSFCLRAKQTNPAHFPKDLWISYLRLSAAKLKRLQSSGPLSCGTVEGVRRWFSIQSIHFTLIAERPSMNFLTLKQSA